MHRKKGQQDDVAMIFDVPTLLQIEYLPRGKPGEPLKRLFSIRNDPQRPNLSIGLGQSLPQSSRPEEQLMIIGKNRNGRIGSLPVYFDEKRLQVGEWRRPWCRSKRETG